MRFCHLCAFDRNDDTAERCRQCGADLEPLEDEEDDADADSAWFHYLQIPGVGTIELVPGRAFRIGREARNELVIPRASADQLASVFWTDDYDEATITEQGAAEGVKLDGVKITGTRTLKGGEELVIGPLRMTYLRRANRIVNAIDAKSATKHRPNPRAQVPNPTPSPDAVAHHRRSTGPVRRTANRSVGAPPAAVCQALEVKKASGTLRVQTEDARGWITVAGGTPRHAAYGGRTGHDALFAILTLPRARCIMTSGVSAKGAGQKLDLSFTEALATIAKIHKTLAPPPAPRHPTPAPRNPTPAPRPAPPRPGQPAARPLAPPRPPGAAPPRAVPPRPGGPGPARPAGQPPRPGGPGPARPAGPPPRPGAPPRRPGPPGAPR